MAISMRFLSGILAGSFAGAAAFSAPDGPRPSQSWERQHSCGWWLAAADGFAHRASIGSGEDGLILSLTDSVFAAWPEEDRPVVELRFDGDPARAVEAESWSTHGSDGGATLGLFLDADARALMAGAASLELWRDDAPILEIPLAGVADHADLELCVPPPGAASADSE